ncbi:hypothetical protein GPX89_36125 [Nocardia sp. ET3-3]|uniref:Uncharacterized protein n=1 Tax=Nocardia terrae TaxID=2675851 RepID=A0A7K1V958_9NOCA|nr:hypothetical protein [Nocardia terrae]MVU82648.1 hypothetical protein [Nocardia terrae]
MGSEVVTGLVGVAGALVGGAASFAGTWVNLRSQHRQAVKARREAVQDRRYAAHLEFVKGVDRFCEAARDARSVLDRGMFASAQELEDAQVEYTKAWTELRELKGAAELAGPPPLSTAVRQVGAAIRDYSSRIDSWYCAALEGLSMPDAELVERAESTFGELCRTDRETVDRVRERYVVQAQAIFSK